MGHTKYLSRAVPHPQPAVPSLYTSVSAPSLLPFLSPQLPRHTPPLPFSSCPYSTAPSLPRPSPLLLTSAAWRIWGSGPRFFLDIVLSTSCAFISPAVCQPWDLSKGFIVECLYLNTGVSVFTFIIFALSLVPSFFGGGGHTLVFF